MGQVSTADVVNLFKRVYGDLQNILPEDQILAKDIPFSAKQKVGEKYLEAVVLTNENGFTLGGSTAEAFELQPAVAGAVKQAEVQPYISVLSSVIPWGVISRSAGGGEKAFFDATKHVTGNNIKSHSKLLEILRLYGQASELLGYVSYATATYRGVAFTNGTGTLGGVAFTNGVSASAKAILLAPGQMAGYWVGMEGAVIQEVSSSAVVQEGSVIGVDSENGIIYVDFAPTAATTTTSNRLCLKGMFENKDMVGAYKIMNTVGTVFGINNTSFSLWKGSTKDLGQLKLTLGRLEDSIAAAVNHAGLMGDVTAYVNPRSWSTLVKDEAALRRYDASYKPSEMANGWENIVFYHQAGKMTIKAHRFIKEGHTFIAHLPDWSRSGSAEVSFSVPGISDKEIIFPLENQAAMAFRSYADQYLFNHAPGRSIWISGINDESST